MFGFKSTKEGSIRIREQYHPESNGCVFTIERYEYSVGYDCCGYEWVGKGNFASMERAKEWAERVRKAADVKYHYI